MVFRGKLQLEMNAQTKKKKKILFCVLLFKKPLHSITHRDLLYA